MSNLTGQAIQNTYPGLLNLETATTGITPSYQQIQDGVGNNTNSRISTNGLVGPNIYNVYQLKADYYGIGINATAVVGVASTQNVINAIPFYDNGLFSYSAITYNVATATTTSDTFEISFYDAQWVPGIGIAPNNLIMSGITLTVNSTGLKTTTLPSTLSFSGMGGGYYFMTYKISNSGVTPTVRLMGSVGATTTIYPIIPSFYGFTTTIVGTSAGSPIKSSALNPASLCYSGLSSFQVSYSTGDAAKYSSTVVAPTYGFLLNTIR